MERAQHAPLVTDEQPQLHGSLRATRRAPCVRPRLLLDLKPIVQALPSLSETPPVAPPPAGGREHFPQQTYTSGFTQDVNLIRSGGLEKSATRPARPPAAAGSAPGGNRTR